MCMWHKIGERPVNFSLVTFNKPHAHKRCILRHCTSIVYILASYSCLVVFITVLFTLKHLIFPALIYVHNARMYNDNFNPYHSIILFYTFIYIYIFIMKLPLYIGGANRQGVENWYETDISFPFIHNLECNR